MGVIVPDYIEEDYGGPYVVVLVKDNARPAAVLDAVAHTDGVGRPEAAQMVIRQQISVIDIARLVDV